MIAQNDGLAKAKEELSSTVKTNEEKRKEIIENLAKVKKYSGMSVRSAVFEVFNTGITHISSKDIRVATGKDEKELHEVLTDICEFERNWETGGKWTLKAEYREKL